MKFCLLYQIIYIKKILNNTIKTIRNNFQEIVLKTHRFKVKGVVHFLKDSTIIQGKQLIDLIVYDKPGSYRFFVTYLFLSVMLNVRINLGINTNELKPLWSISNLFSSSVWSEREVFDMYGIIFLESTDLRRILTDYGFKGYPLRKDFPLAGFVELFYADTYSNISYKKVSFVQAYRKLTSY